MAERLCEGRVAIVTGAGRGLGRQHALALAAHGAAVVVNDLGASASGVGADDGPAHEVAEAIRAAGGEAAVDGADVADWEGAAALVRGAVERFGRLDILVNNAGILRDRMLVNMTEQDWDSVIRVHLKGTFAPLHHAANHWRSVAKAGGSNDARVINTTSHSGLFSNVGQANYAAAKAGIASLSVLAARELGRLGVLVNAVAPRATTRMTEGLRAWTEAELEQRDPQWVSALVVWLASPASGGVSGRVFEAWGKHVGLVEGPQHGPQAAPSRDPAELGARLREVLKHARPNAGIDLGDQLDP